MGGCCFTPKKTQLLWWYWLLLFSIVGIPMFAAALYVRRAARHGVLEPWQVRNASRLFWFGACGSLALLSLVLPLVVGEIRGLSDEGHSSVVWFVLSFVFWLMVAVGAAKLTEKAHRWYARAALVTCCALIPAAGTWLPYALLSYGAAGLMPMNVMKFLVCMLPAHYWYRFTVSPGTKRAWVFLGALAVGTMLFWVVSQYGEAAHINLRQWLISTNSELRRV